MSEKIFENAKIDFSPGVSGYYSDETMEKILARAQEKLAQETGRDSFSDGEDLTAAWNRVVADFHRNQRWGFLPEAKPKKKSKYSKEDSEAYSFFRVLLISALFMKPGMYFFGIQYSKYPGEGYGIGLLATIAISLFSYGMLIYKYRNMKD